MRSATTERLPRLYAQCHKLVSGPERSPAKGGHRRADAGQARVAVEAAGNFGWSRWTTDDGAMVGMTGFGASAPGERLFKEFKLTPEHVAGTVRQVLSRAEGRTGKQESR